jgi:hypothetical protein
VPNTIPISTLPTTAVAASFAVSFRPVLRTYSATGCTQSGTLIYLASGRASRPSSRRISADSVQTRAR